MGAMGTPTCVPPLHIERLEVNSRAFTQHLSRMSTSSIAAACYVREGRRPGKEWGPGKDSTILLLLLSPALLGARLLLF